MKPVDLCTERTAVLAPVQGAVKDAAYDFVQGAVWGAMWHAVGGAVWDAVEEEVL